MPLRGGSGAGDLEGLVRLSLHQYSAPGLEYATAFLDAGCVAGQPTAARNLGNQQGGGFNFSVCFYCYFVPQNTVMLCVCICECMFFSPPFHESWVMTRIPL